MGVPIEVSNDTSKEVRVSVGHTQTVYEIGATSAFILAAPGRQSVTCSFADGEEGIGPATAQVDIEDPSGLWVSPELSCPGRVSGAFPPYASQGRLGDVLTLAKDDYGRGEGSTFIRVGYPSSNPASVGVMRDGELVARLDYEQTSDGSWHPIGSEKCE
jgi:hypothetical protein